MAARCQWSMLYAFKLFCVHIMEHILTSANTTLTTTTALPPYELTETVSQLPKTSLHICDTCGRGFSRYDNLERHKLTHQAVKPFVCEACGRAFSRKTHLKRHQSIHTGIKPFKCSICGFGFSQNVNLTRHMKTHENSVTLYEPAVLYQREKPFKCNLCGRAFSRNCDLTRHMKNHEESLSQPAESMTVTLPLPPATPASVTIAHEKPFKCNLCGSVFSINSELTKHMKKHKGLLQQHEDTKIFLPQSNGAGSIISQPVPTQQLQTQPLIQQQQQQLHSDRPYICSLCNRSFSRNGDLTRHMRSHPENPLNCKECLKAFTEKSDAGMHEMIHAALMPHVCETCDDLDHQPLQQMVEIQTEEHGDDDLTPRDPSEVPHYMNI
ncbi:KRAB [Acanthosepion pharaonis]|uniref:KRAB n=1 Tax=Acanthosepion pharaonis TaxID=158019 RepID=A0A812ANN9_ACAPH|nr:KRAB [Sepia pharaonis]